MNALLLSITLCLISYGIAHTQSFDEHLKAGDACVHKDNMCEALYHFEQAAYLNPHHLGTQLTLAITYCKLGRIRDSIETYKKILAQIPGSLAIIYNIGYALKCGGYTTLAIELFRHIIASDPDNENAHLALALALLQQGNFKEGWKEHVWNLKKQNKYAAEFRDLLKNNNLAAKRILLLPEGGLGDSIQFIRYCDVLKKHGAYVIVAIQPPLFMLFQSIQSIDMLLTTQSPKPACDAHITLMSLPAAFEDTQETIPQKTPYITPPSHLIDYWKERISSDSNFKVGICWQASIHNDSSRLHCARRGIPLDYFSILHDIPHISLYSLQKKDGLSQLTNMSNDCKIIFFEDFDESHGPFMDTAALMMHMDLIISVDTATAHLAGALGRPIWLLLPYVTDWRWVENQNSSVWYPTMQIFKQPHPFDWKTVLSQVHEQLMLATKR